MRMLAAMARIATTRKTSDVVVVAWRAIGKELSATLTAIVSVLPPAATFPNAEKEMAEAGPATIVTPTVDETHPCETVSVCVPVVVGAENCAMRPSEERGRIWPPDHDNVPAEITFPFVS